MEYLHCLKLSLYKVFIKYEQEIGVNKWKKSADLPTSVTQSG